MAVGVEGHVDLAVAEAVGDRYAAAALGATVAASFGVVNVGALATW